MLHHFLSPYYARRLRGLGVILPVAVMVLYPVYFLVSMSLKEGDGTVDGSTGMGLGNYVSLLRYSDIVGNTLYVSGIATIIAVAMGFIAAYCLVRLDLPLRRTLSYLIVVPYYFTPLLGALAWSLLGTEGSGYLNRLWNYFGGTGSILNMGSGGGIAWVMALFEGSVAFIIIRTVLLSINPTLEEASTVLGASRVRTALRVTLPLIRPGLLGALIFVLAEMLGSFSAALVLGVGNRFYVLTTAIFLMITQYPARLPLAAALGVTLFALMFALVFIYRWMIANRSYTTVTGKAYQRRLIKIGPMRWLVTLALSAYVFVTVILPLVTLLFAAAGVTLDAAQGVIGATSQYFKMAFAQNAVKVAIQNSLILGLMAATITVAVTTGLSWTINRTNMSYRGALEYMAMFPQAAPRIVFALGIMWAWLVIPGPVYGTIWLLLIAYVTVFTPLGIRTISGVLLQIDKSLDEAGKMCGAGFARRLRTINLPLLAPGLTAAWVLIFIASVRELSASIILAGAKSQVLSPAIVDAWSYSSTNLTAAIALIQVAVIAVVVFIILAIFKRFKLIHD